MDVKIKAHIGDSLASLFARILISKIDNLKRINGYNAHFIHTSKLTSNDHFTYTCVRFNLFNARGQNVWVLGSKYYGTMYEALLYDMYVSKGFDEAFSFFRETAYKLYAEKNEEMPLLT